MSNLMEWHNEQLGQKAVEALKRNNFKAVYFPTRQQAVEHILTLITPDATVGIAGSWTIQDLDLDSLLSARGNTVFNHNRPGLTREESMTLRRKELLADVFLTGSNAVTLDGKLVNVDGAGNRVAAMIFGPKKVIVIAGINKIVRDTDEAESRIELYAAPINAKRLNRNTPCTQTGICMDCQSPERICNVTTILRKCPLATDIEVVIIGESLGF